MPRGRKANPPSVNACEFRPPLTPKARENQLISLAIDVAERQMRDGTVSAQVLTHYLKLGTERERLETEILEKQSELIAAKTETLKSQKRIEELYSDAIEAMRRYSGVGYNEDPNIC